MKKVVIKTHKAPDLPHNFSQAMKVGSFVFVSGQGPIDPETHEVKGDIREQTAKTLENLKAILEAAGASLSDVVSTTVYLTNLNNFLEMDQVYKTYFPKDPPPRATVQAGLLRNMLIEIQAIACIQDLTEK